MFAYPHDVHRLRRGVDQLFDQMMTDWAGFDEMGPSYGPSMLGGWPQQQLLTGGEREGSQGQGGETALTTGAGQGQQGLTQYDPFQSAVAPMKLDIIDAEDKYLISCDIPGVPKENIKLNVRDNRLTIEAERSQQKEDKGRSFRRVERSWGKTSRTITLPRHSDAQNIKARLGEHGELHIEVPKLPGAHARQISVEGNAAPSRVDQPVSVQQSQPQSQQSSQPPSPASKAEHGKEKGSSEAQPKPAGK
jgi:HSP20 family protein